MTDATPYINEDGDLWYKVSDVVLPKARALAAEFARDTIGDIGRSRFKGKERGGAHEHELYDGTDCAVAGCSTDIEVWHFEVYER